MRSLTLRDDPFITRPDEWLDRRRGGSRIDSPLKNGNDSEPLA